MDNLLRNYLEKKFYETEEKSNNGPGPVVTFSREFGCPSKLIAQLLVDTLNKYSRTEKKPKWRFINKEILEEAARELELKPVEMNYMLNSGEKGLVEDMLISFSTTYVSNIKIKKTITRVIQGFASQGHVVMVGRGSAAILQGRQNTLNLRLVAPVEWRIREIMKLKNINAGTARKMVKLMDAKRTSLIELFLGHQMDLYLFDMLINCSRSSLEEIVSVIFGLMEARNMFRESII